MPLLSERRLARINRAVVSGRIVPYLASATIAVTAVAGIAAWILSPKGFDSLGDAMWWAAQSVTTVGYGDVVPETSEGRVIGVVVMAFGVASVSLITALVTAAFVSYQQDRLGRDTERDRELLAALDRIANRLDALERRAP